MPHYLVHEGAVLYGADTLEGVLKYFTERTGVRITNADDSPRGAFDADGVDIRYEQSDLFDDEEDWQVNVDGKVYSFHRTWKPCKYLYLHRTPALNDYSDAPQPDATRAWGHDDPAAAMRAAATAGPARLQDRLRKLSEWDYSESSDEDDAPAPPNGPPKLRDVPEPLLRLALALPGAMPPGAGPEWSHESPDAGSHRWIRAPQRQCGLVLHPELSCSGWEPRAPPFMWLVGYFDRERAERAVMAVCERRAAEEWQTPGCVVVWGDDVPAAAAAAMRLLGPKIVSTYDDDGHALDDCSELMTLLRDALWSGIEQRWPHVPSLLGDRQLAEDLAWLRLVTWRAPRRSATSPAA